MLTSGAVVVEAGAVLLFVRSAPLWQVALAANVGFAALLLGAALADRRAGPDRDHPGR